MSKHTPGPWKVTVENDDSDWAIVTGKGGNIVANVNSESGPDLPPLVSTKMPQRANTNLIDAAPDLLEALEMVRDADNDNGRKIPSLARAKIDAAIAKARGEQ